jgi:hypothetical protein
MAGDLPFGRGGFSWIIIDQEDGRCGAVRDHQQLTPMARSSQQCELMAIGSFLLLLEDFLKYYRIMIIRCMVIYAYVDNQGAINHVDAIKAGTPSCTYPKNADALAIIARCKRVVKCLHLIHVDSHQDNKRPGFPKNTQVRYQHWRSSTSLLTASSPFTLNNAPGVNGRQ